jgi:hypothetical protein
VATISAKLASLRDKLYKLDNREPLSKLSLTVIIALDIFILIVLFNGLADHTRQLTSPEEYVPYDCREVYIDSDWSETNRLDELQPLVLSGYKNISYRYKGRLERADTALMHPTCAALYESIKQIADEKPLHSLFVERQQLQNQRNRLRRELERNRATYDTSLLENIADKRSAGDGLGATSSQSQNLSKSQDKVVREIAAIDSKLNASPLITALWESISRDEAKRKALVTDYKQYQYWYALKKLLWQMLFMLPLFILFYLWSGYSARKHHTVQTLIASHLLVVTSIPIILKIIELVLDLIPRHFFRNLFELLEALHLIAIWHYLVIFATVAAALLLIYLIQKKLFNQQRTYQRRLMKGACYACGLTLPPHAEHCPYCGESQCKECPACHATTPVKADFCTRCGARQ